MRAIPSAVAVDPDAEAVSSATGGALRRELNVRDLTLFGIVCLTGPRWIPAAAHAGPGMP